MKKIFVDIYLAFNLGDDLFLDILAKRYPDCKFTINYLGRDYDEFITSYNNVSRRKYTFLNKVGQFFKVSDSITNYDEIAKQHDALIFIGGSIFREESYHHSLYHNRLNMVKEFKKRNKPTFVLGANFGPLHTKEFLNDYTTFFNLCYDVCFRDLYSYELFKDISSVRYAPDIVFQMNVDKYKVTLTEKRVGFSIIDVNHKQGLAKYHESYINSTVRSIEVLIKQGYECYLMSFCEREGDLKVIADIKASLSPKALTGVHIYEYKGNLEEAINLISSFRLFVAARFHANIIALLLEIGILPIIYSEKTVNMLKDINLGKLLIDMENLHRQYDLNTLEKAFNNTVDLEGVCQKANEQFKSLDKFLKN